jgi:Fe-S oxidoreductase
MVFAAVVAAAGCGWRKRSVPEISEMRFDSAIDTQTQIVATACPFCLQMFEDAARLKRLKKG